MLAISNNLRVSQRPMERLMLMKTLRDRLRKEEVQQWTQNADVIRQWKWVGDIAGSSIGGEHSGCLKEETKNL